eukprot:COSAG01_NODE_663_length_14420_cov_77.011382_4_plen_848_part_00
MQRRNIASLDAWRSVVQGPLPSHKSKKTRKFTSKEPREIAQQTRILRAAQAADSARDRAGRPSAKQIGSRATLDILEKQEAREKKRAQQKKERKFTDQAPPEIAQQTRTLKAAQAADAARDRAGKPSVKQIGSRATLTILEKLEAREKKRAQQKKQRKFTDQAPPEIAQQTRTLKAAQAADAARDRAGRPSVKQIGSRATLAILEKRDRKEQVKEARKEDRAPLRPRSKRYDSGTALARKTDKTSRKDALLIATAAGQAKAKQKADQKAIDQYARKKRVATDRKAKSLTTRGKVRAKRLDNRADKKFARRPKTVDSLGAPDVDVKPDAPEPTPADMDDDVQITDVVTAADRDAAARAAAVTLDDDVPGVVESPQGRALTNDDLKWIPQNQGLLTTLDGPKQIVSVLDGDPPQFVLRDGSVVQGVQRPIDLTQEGPTGVVPEPVVDLTQDEDPGGVIAGAVGGEEQPMEADEPVGGDDQDPVANEPASRDLSNPEQPDNILQQQPQGGDDDMDEEDDLVRRIVQEPAQITVQGGDEDMDEDDEPVADGAQGGDDDMDEEDDLVRRIVQEPTQITVQGGDEDMDEDDEPVADGAQGGDDDMDADETPPEQPEPEPTFAAPTTVSTGTDPPPALAPALVAQLPTTTSIPLPAPIPAPMEVDSSGNQSIVANPSVGTTPPITFQPPTAMTLTTQIRNFLTPVAPQPQPPPPPPSTPQQTAVYTQMQSAQLTQSEANSVLARLQTLAQQLPSMSNVEKFEAGKSVAEDGDIQQMVAEGLFKWEDLLVANSQRPVVSYAKLMQVISVLQGGVREAGKKYEQSYTRYMSDKIRPGPKPIADGWFIYDGPHYLDG